MTWEQLSLFPELEPPVQKQVEMTLGMHIKKHDEEVAQHILSHCRCSLMDTCPYCTMADEIRDGNYGQRS